MNIDYYVTHINKFPLLSEEVTKSLLKEFEQTKSIQVRNKLVNSNLRLVLKQAFKYKNANKMDLIQEGVLGLIRGIEKFQLSKNTALSTYLTPWIKAYMLRYVISTSNIVKVGTTFAHRKLFFSSDKFKNKLFAQGKEVDENVLAEHFAIPVEVIKETLPFFTKKANVSIDSPNEESEFTEKIYLKTEETPHDLLQKGERDRKTNDLTTEFLGTLGERESLIFKRRFLSDEKYTFREIGEELGSLWTRQRIKQIEAELKTNFGKFLKRNNIDRYV
jgi:RNA polymerase sigma factor (sigma-70 family)